MELFLGHRRDDGTPFSLPGDSLLRHVVALGASGSGKTVLCKALVEEVVRHGIPAICVDPQGDLCSLLVDGDPAELERRGVDPALARAFRARADVVVFTPASRKGIPLCVDPIDGGLAALAPDERLRAQSRAASRLTGLLGFDLAADEGAAVLSVLDQALGEMVQDGTPPSLAAIAARLAEPARFAALAKPARVEAAAQRLARLEVGSRRLLFTEGAPVDIALLLGRDSTALPDRTRVSVIYLNTLDAQEDKEFFVATLAERLYAWMLSSPSASPQALFYLDEVAPFLPPVRKPASKEGLQLLLKQARKYGLGCLLATQNPGDVDYKALAQIGTWMLGRITTRQDLQKLAPALRGLAEDADALVEALPSQTAGELIALSPDALEAPTPMRTRWLFTAHETFTEPRIAEAMEPLRARFAASERVVDAPAVDASAEPHSGIAPGERSAAESARTSAQTPPTTAPSARSAAPVVPSSDLGLPLEVQVVRLAIDETEAHRHADEQCRSGGLMGTAEEVDRVELRYRLLHRVDFEETTPAPLLRRLTGQQEDHRIGSVYFHATSLHLLTFTPKRGIAFVEQVVDFASDVEDLDGYIELTSSSPAVLAVDEDEVRGRRTPEEVARAFAERFQATRTGVSLVFVPVWTLVFREGRGQRYRRVTLDGMHARPCRWP